MADDAVALGIKTPDPNGFTNTLSALSSLNTQAQHAGLLSTEAELNKRRLNALQAYGDAYKAGDPDAAKQLAQFPEIQSQALQANRLGQQYSALDNFANQGGKPSDISTLNAFPEARNVISESLSKMTQQQKEQANFTQDQVARTAWNSKNGQQWDAGLDQLLGQGIITPEQAQSYRGKFTPALREQVIDHAMNMRDILDTHGIPQGAAAAAMVPSQIKVEQNRPMGVGPNEGVIIPGGSGAAATSSPAVTPSPLSMGATTPSATTGGKFASEIPVVPINPNAPKTNGTVIAPKSISQVGAEQAAVERAKQIDDQAAAAASTRGQLATLQATLDKGFTTDASAPARAVVSAWTNAVLGKDAAKSISGIDPTQADVFNKDATRMGLEYARQTEGSRESMQAIRTALAGNPQLAATTEGNKAIIGIMDQTAKWQQDMQQAKDDYYQKNGHYVGFGSWWNGAHPVSEYISKAMPFPLPTSKDAAKPGTTYMTGHGPATWDGKQFTPLQPGAQ